MKIGLLNPALLGPNIGVWGDYHFGRSLADAFERRGASVEQRFWPEWEELGPVDLCITLRGKRLGRPRPAAINAIWVMSHPSLVSAEELQQYDVVFTASDTHRNMLAGKVDAPMHTLRQCTDATTFQTVGAIEDEGKQRRGAIFVANSRGVRRPILNALRQAKFPVSIIGRDWGKVGLDDLVRATSVSYDKLPDTYRRSRLALNDHWCDMKYFGIINNRVFDCLATGTPIISDRFPELESVCGSSVLYCEPEADLERAIAEFYFRYERLLERTRALWAKIGGDYTFDRRAEQILTLAGSVRPQRARTNPVDREPSPAARQLTANLDRLKNELGRDRLRVLHLSPQPELQQIIMERADVVTYLTAGFGIGPWLVDLTGGLETLAPQSYDCVIFDGSSPKDITFESLLSQNGEMFTVNG